MNCEKVDTKGYFFEELTLLERQAVEDHLRVCPACREEVERLSATRSALGALREEELPRRIAFVSDKVLEPGFWRRLWNSAPRLGFASAAMLAVAIVTHGLVRPAPVVQPAAMDTAAFEARVSQEVAQRIDAAVEKAAAQVEVRQGQRLAQLVTASENRIQQQRQADLLTVEENFRVLQKRVNVYYRASNEIGGER